MIDITKAGALNRANHTGTQPIDFVEGLPEALDELNPQNNLDASSAPGVNDDASDGYGIGSIWIFNDTIYRCLDATPGAAVWVSTEVTLSDLGSAAFASTSDFDTAGSAAAAREFARQRTNHTGTQPLATISDAGEAARRGVVGGAGDLMARGFGGLGGVPPTIDTFETPLLTGFYRTVGANLADFPIGRESLLAYSTCVSVSRYSNAVYRLSFVADSGNQELFLSGHNENGELLSRIARFYSNVNILGTVSQSGGAPTGAIIERGSNANGEYVKFADGTLFMWLTAQASIPLSGIGSEISVEVNYPVRILSNSTTRLFPTVNTAASAWSVPDERWKFDIGARTNTADYGNVQGRRREAGVAVTGEFLVFVSARWA